MAEQQVSPRLWWAVLGASGLLLFVGLGWVDAMAPDEPRYLQVAEELRAMDQGLRGLVVMHLNGEVYTQKPPLFYWIAAAIGAPFSRVTVAAARLPSAIAALGTIWLTLVLGSRLFGSRVGVLGAALLLTVQEFGFHGRRIQLDAMLTFFELAAMTSFWWLDRGLGPRTRHLLLLHGAMGLAVLTKGPVGFLLPSLSIAAYLAWEGRLRDMVRVFPWWSFALSIGPGLVWLGAATALAPAGFADEAVGTNLIGRFFSGTSHARPFWYFLGKFPGDFVPWTLLLPLVLWAGHRILRRDEEADDPTRRAWRFLLATFLTSFVFFSISSGKRGLYLIPIFPATSLLCADALVRWLTGRTQLPRPFVAGSLLLLVFGLVLGVEAVLASQGRSLLLALFLEPGALAELHAGLLLALGVAVLVVCGLAVGSWLLARSNRTALLTYVAIVVAAVYGVELAATTLAYPALEPVTSIRPIAIAAAARTEPGERIGLFRDPQLLGGLAYYGHRRVAILETPEDARRFLDETGGPVVLKKRKLERISGETAIVSSARHGRREIVVVVDPKARSTRPGIPPPG
jgi:4-amino-4-deoxy-L-arabinose transferase-like glycosyltransferase